MARLAGKVALITGAAGGQGVGGSRIVRARGRRGDVDRHRRGKGGGARGAAAGGRRPGRATAQFRVQDAASEQDWIDTVAATLAAFGGLHVLVNNAGTIARQGIVNTTLEAWNRTIAVNLTGPLLGMKHAAPAIRDTGRERRRHRRDRQYLLDRRADRA